MVIKVDIARRSHADGCYAILVQELPLGRRWRLFRTITTLAEAERLRRLTERFVDRMLNPVRLDDDVIDWERYQA